MSPNAEKYSFPFIMIHWVVVLLIVLLLGLGWYVQSLSSEFTGRSFLVEVHISLGLTTLILVTLLLIIRLISRPPPLPENYPRWLAVCHYTSNFVIYLCLVLIPVTGYLQMIFNATTVKFWGFPLPLWGMKDTAWADFFWTAHGRVAFVLTVFLIIHVGIVVIGIVKKHGLAARMLPGGTSESRYLVIVTEAPPVAVKIAQKLARSVRFLGWIDFWLQLALAFVSGLLLIFATSGQTFSPGANGLGDSMFWAHYAFIMILLTLPIAFYYTRAARKIVSTPNTYIDPERKMSFWILGLGIIVGSLGLLTSLAGVGASISLLIAKTVSQPPGIAITDPTRIIRALDVFILLVNFNLLMAHFIGTSISVWLAIKASEARFEYLKITSSGSKSELSEINPH